MYILYTTICGLSGVIISVSLNIRSCCAANSCVGVAELALSCFRNSLGEIKEGN